MPAAGIAARPLAAISGRYLCIALLESAKKNPWRIARLQHGTSPSVQLCVHPPTSVNRGFTFHDPIFFGRSLTPAEAAPFDFLPAVLIDIVLVRSRWPILTAKATGCLPEIPALDFMLGQPDQQEWQPGWRSIDRTAETRLQPCQVSKSMAASRPKTT